MPAKTQKPRGFVVIGFVLLYDKTSKDSFSEFGGGVLAGVYKAPVPDKTSPFACPGRGFCPVSGGNRKTLKTSLAWSARLAWR